MINIHSTVHINNVHISWKYSNSQSHKTIRLCIHVTQVTKLHQLWGLGGGGAAGRGGWGAGGGGSKKGRGRKRRKIIIYTNNICTYFVIPVATSPCTTVKPEINYQGAALQHLLHKVKKLKTQKYELHMYA